MRKEISGSRAKQAIQVRNSKKFFIVIKRMRIVKFRTAVAANQPIIPRDALR